MNFTPADWLSRGQQFQDVAVQDGRNIIAVTATDSAPGIAIDVLTVRKVNRASASRIRLQRK